MSSHYDKYLSISPHSLGSIFAGEGEIKYNSSRARQTGNYEFYELRLHVVPHNSESVLLKKIPRKHRLGARYYTAEIPNRLVTIPEYMSDIPKMDFNALKEILLDNAYLALYDNAGDDFNNTIEAAFHYGELRISPLLKESGLNPVGEHFSVTYGVWPDPDIMNGEEHCIDVYLFVQIQYASIDSKFIYVPANMFDHYCESKYPESYAVMMGFSEGDYDESSPDFRMNPDGKARVRAAIDLLKQKRLL